MGLMEIEVAQMEHRLRAAEMEQRHRLRRILQEREQADGPGRVQTDWPLITLRFGRFQVALLRTVWLPSGRVHHSHGASRLLPG
ncbi:MULTISPECIES: hypothetical protein [unclassified Arthrobacter]|uniref:hypothetical protein n=1 Tax=unclassified Arthrobacter TaxID=235627 RepID=UPI002106072C|nr:MULTISPECIES: hypothetical protein [unclassified Arthrobacter]MCQ1947529.1 hypothetical protein [Arthrobacter sp. zg-Y1116]MCQ1987481.1 hypothetical protein [Arthrobacter sp. zg-Y844]MCQ1996825.1 hypothetical protein [Arthrobacter sp. zg-Y1171]UWX82418.1 hypothetical protein N2L00_03000 [Arthrobacter sp. zg-Y1171]